MNPAPGWYPDPGHTNLQAYWDGQQWHLGATKLTESAEWGCTGSSASWRAWRCRRSSRPPTGEWYQRQGPPR